MAVSPPPAVGRIFLSYRREETAYPAAWLYDRLADRFGDGQVFKDVDSIELGDDFVEVLTTAVGSCDVLLAVIGLRWLDATDEDGRRRLDDPDDFVRLEIEAALARNVRVIPILVDGARMPRATDLPPSLVRLVRRQALELSPNRFELDTSRLLRVLEKTLAEVRTAQAQAAGTAAPAGTAAAPSTSELPAAPEQQQRAESRPTSSGSHGSGHGAATVGLGPTPGRPAPASLHLGVGAGRGRGPADRGDRRDRCQVWSDAFKCGGGPVPGRLLRPGVWLGGCRQQTGRALHR
jgi:hypothetical protein